MQTNSGSTRCERAAPFLIYVHRKCFTFLWGNVCDRCVKPNHRSKTFPLVRIVYGNKDGEIRALVFEICHSYLILSVETVGHLEIACFRQRVTLLRGSHSICQIDVLCVHSSPNRDVTLASPEDES